ncbi:uncharacterized protein ARMOST_12136 [Armillaria ostoyae]|uniref:Protein kinase domain-containing protein n=1 Tax=Armillaria ostoyae TaxID=47428 RepID=A0A284RJ33_ARMOS|nr:uncharacterized protein ARMOST_12136 [Armillaria ostoyae]
MDKFFQNRHRKASVRLNIPWGHTMDDFYWIRRLPDSDVKPIWTRSMLDEFGENFGDEPPVTRVEPRRLRPWSLLKVPNDDSLFGLVDEMCNGDHSLKPRLFDAVKDAHPFAGFESSEKGVELPVEPILANGDVAASTGESVVERAVKLRDKHPLLTETDAKDDDKGSPKILVQADDIVSDAMSVEIFNVERKASDVQSLPTGSKGVSSPPPLLTGVTKAENDALKVMSVEECDVEGKSGTSHHLSAGSTKNDTKGDEIDTPKVFVLTDIDMTGGSGEGSNTEGKVGDGQLCTEDGVPEVSAETAMSAEESKIKGNTAGNYTLPMGENDACKVPIVVEGKAGDRHNLTTDTGATDNEPNKVFVENDNALMGNTTMSAVQGRAGDIHDLAMGKNDIKINKIDTPTVDVETDDDLTPAERRAMEPHSTTNYETIQKLEERIPEEYFPDILLVNDPSSATISGFSLPDRRPCSLIVRYKHVWPKLERDGKPATLFNNDFDCRSAFHWTPTKEERYAASASRRIATLNLSGAPRLGKGSHSVVLKAALRLPTPLKTQTGDPCVSVAAKLALINCADRELLENEGRVYDAFPEHLQESYCGYNLVDPMDHPVPVGACVPKFFGYYVPVQEGREATWRQKALKRIKEQVDGRRAREAKREAKKKGVDGAVETGEAADANVKLAEEEEDNDSSDDDFCCYDYDYSPPPRVKEVRSPILLLEECGTPIEPEQFSEDERSECFSLVLRLHHADFVQNSLYTRNILRQPGPLTVRPSERSLEMPSFRIIDFGRGVFGPWYIERKLGVQGGRPGPPTVPTREEMTKLKEAETDRKLEAKKEMAIGWHGENMKYETRKAMGTMVVDYRL